MHNVCIMNVEGIRISLGSCVQIILVSMFGGCSSHRIDEFESKQAIVVIVVAATLFRCIRKADCRRRRDPLECDSFGNLVPQQQRTIGDEVFCGFHGG